ncbi:MAG: site-specific integrase [Planctomycetota bacterium]|nr:site-specific integrase [Planctomycetota bacterium]
MASLEQRGNAYRIVFRHAGQKITRSLKTHDERAANACLARLEDNLRRLELGLLTPPEGVDIATFLLSDGRTQLPPVPHSTVRSVGDLLDQYLSSISPGSLEETTLAGMRIHVRRLKLVLGDKARLDNFSLSDLQKYVDKRARDKGIRKRDLSTATIRKELRTLTSAWTWGLDSGTISKPLPKKGLRFPKMAEKPPFQTWEEIERKIARGGLTDTEKAELWDCLFLTLSEIDELLDFVRQHARQPFIYPMFLFAAHTGARRSELIRSEIDDIGFDAATVIVREKKRVRGKLSTRRVPLSPLLYRVLHDWVANHPGGKYTFCLGPPAAGTQTARDVTTQITGDEAHDHFKRTLAGSKWDKLRGWHVFRHSFCSNCAAKGIDQRIINAWVGHQTEEMVRRYRHLIPNQQQEAIRLVFGDELTPTVSAPTESVGS